MKPAEEVARELIQTTSMVGTIEAERNLVVKAIEAARREGGEDMRERALRFIANLPLEPDEH